MTERADLLVEIGTEELPPASLAEMSQAFARELGEKLGAHGLAYGEVSAFATPRRLAALFTSVPMMQPDRKIERRGPGLDVAFGEDGKPTQAAIGFAKSCGVVVGQLERLETKQGRWLVYRTTEAGARTTALLPAMVSEAVAKLPVARRMRWSDLDVEFVRPVHWVLMRHGDEVVEADILGVRSAGVTYGHRFHHPGAIELAQPSDYAAALHDPGHVIAAFDWRKDVIRKQVLDAAARLGGRPVMDEALLDENAALVEWPVAITGSFDAEFLELPASVLIATMQGHQRYFPVMGEGDRLLANFIAVANIESTHPETVRHGNERVIRPRLSDAAFFYKTDMERKLESRREDLKSVVFHEKLGSLYDKSERVSRLAGIVAIAMGQAPEAVRLARRAGSLSKCDLLTEMVGEFPELQGTMGGAYARAQGEDAAVADALAEAYLPRFAGDAIPKSQVGQALSIADRLDTLVGIFGVGEAPTGDKDPYALRRAALGALRIMIEGGLALDLRKLLTSTAEGLGSLADAGAMVDQVMEFMLDRLKAYFSDQGVPHDVFAAVQARQPAQPHDFARRVQAVHAFRQLPEAASLAAANKRIQNILKQAGDGIPGQVDDSLFSEDAEWNLAAKALGLTPRVRELLKSGDYTGAMSSLAGLRDNVDEFFDKVKVMDDDERIRNNRLALLNNIRRLFLETADISRLQIQ
ncbi:MAG: glycine--tRNA ligase subunit beta [Gammaproteobacteria bacterium]|nr:glycine--tRNA ligase subunit beta [Gammaproteobacteria bacterium]